MNSQPHRFTNDKLLQILSLSQNATAIYTGEEITIQTANHVMIKFWGKDQSVIGKPLSAAVPELSGQPFLDLLGEVWRTGVTYEAKDAETSLFVDGKLQTFYFDFIYRAIKNEAGEVDCILHTATDVTELNRGRNLIAQARMQKAALDRELMLNQELGAANEALNASNEELASAMEELSAINNELQHTRNSLQNLNDELETRIAERTEMIEGLYRELEAINEELSASNKDLASSNEGLAASNQELATFNLELEKLYEQLKISQDETQLAINAADLATFDLNPGTGKFTGNALLKSWFGLPTEAEIELNKAVEVILEDDRERVVTAINQSLNPASGGDYDISYTIVDPSNPEPRIVRAKGKALFNEQQQPVRLSGVLLDVTEQFTSQHKMQQLINSLSASEQKFRLLIQKAPVAINVFRTKRLIIENVNDKMLEIWGKSAEVEGKTFPEVLPEMAYQPFLEILNAVFASGEPYYGLENKVVIPRNGVSEERYFNFIFQPVAEENGKIDRILQVVTEVTEQVNARKEIADMNTRLNIAIDAGGLGSTEVDLATGTMQCNAQFKKCFGRTPDQDFTYPELFAAMLPKYKDKIKQLVAIAIRDHGIYQAEYEVLWPDSSVHWISAHGKARYDCDGKAIKMVGIISDVTETKADEQRKNDFIGMVSHELKTPLTSLGAYVQMLEVRAKKSEDDFTASALQKANKQVKKMTTMINGFLNVSRLESGKIHIDRQRFDLAALIREVEEESVMTGGSHEVIFASVEEIFIDADRDKIGHVINNFMSNAIKYSPFGSTINVACKRIGNLVEVAVKDEGRGIKKEDQQKLFERYYRVKDQPSTISGFGIGLYLCAEVINRHNGKIWVESEPDQGSTFYFSLPFSEAGEPNN